MSLAAIRGYVQGVFDSHRDEILCNRNYRRTLLTDAANKRQIVLMTLRHNEDIPSEMHTDTTQYLHVVQGLMYVSMNAEPRHYHPGQGAFVQPGTRHYVANGSPDKEPLIILSYYSPPHWPEDYRSYRQRP